MKIFETNLDLFYASRKVSIGSLAFSLSSQTLFIRVADGWREVKVGGALRTI